MSRNDLRKIRHRRVRGKVRGTANKPRLNVFRSLRYIYAQLIDDEDNKVLTEADSRQILKKKMPSKEKKVPVEVTSAATERAEEVGKLIAEKSIKKGFREIVFDRGGYKYHGQVKALAEAARKAGLKF